MKLDQKSTPSSQQGSQSGAAPAGPGKSTRSGKLVQRNAGGAAPQVDAGAVYSQATSGSGGEVPYRAEMERGFGTDFSSVQAHTGRASEMGAINAKAATTGTDNKVAFASSSPSKDTVAHELAHVVQGRNSGGGAVQGKSTVSQPDSAAERQADTAAATVAGGGTVDPGSLTATPEGVQRDDVEVSAGDRTETESDTRVIDQGNAFEDQMNAWSKLVAWKDGTSISFARNGATVTRAPTNNDAMFFFIELTPAQRNNVWMDTDGVLTHIFQNFSNAEAGQVMGMCDFPVRWKIIHWFRDIVSGNGGRETVMSMIFNAPLGQRLDAVRDESAVELMTGTFGQDHPENIFGDQIKTQLYPNEETMLTFDGAHPKFAAWRNSAEKLDAEARWTLVGNDPVNAITQLKSQQSMGGRNKWTSLLYWGPRGAALTPTMRENVDKAALTSGIGATDRGDLFLTRWNCSLQDPGATDAVFQQVWTCLQGMPLMTISSEVVTRIELRIAQGGGAYTDYPTSGGFGNIWVGTNNPTNLAYTDHTIRHEIGHAADTQLGGFANISSKPPILWKKWWTQEPWLREMMTYMDAPSGEEGNAFLQLMQAAMANSNFTSPFGAFTATGTLTAEQERQKLWSEVQTTFNTQGLSQALTKLKTAGKHTATPATIKKMVDDGRGGGGGGTHPSSEPDYVRDHYFLKKYGEHFAYHKDGGKEVWANSKLRAYTLCSPYEYFADLFAAYFETETDRAKNVPAWTAGYFQSLESRYDADAADDPNNTRSTAYGNSQAPQL